MGSCTSFEQLECWKACRIVVKWVREMTMKFPRTEFDLKDNVLEQQEVQQEISQKILEGFITRKILVLSNFAWLFI